MVLGGLTPPYDPPVGGYFFSGFLAATTLTAAELRGYFFVFALATCLTTFLRALLALSVAFFAACCAARFVLPSLVRLPIVDTNNQANKTTEMANIMLMNGSFVFILLYIFVIYLS
jgi:hypothetical protein